MKILVFCQHYLPEPFRLNDLCEEMVRRGHEVTVVTGEPNYPEGIIYKGYEGHQRAEEVMDGVRVLRCPIVPRKTGAFHRMLNYFSYPVSAKKRARHLLASDGQAFDVVFVNQLSPVLMAKPAIAYKKKYGAPILLYCLDLWPVSLVAGGVEQGSLIYRMFHRISGRIYRAADRILVTSRLFQPYMEKEFGVDARIIDYLPQYAEEIFEKIPCRPADGTTRLVFAGNVGTAQSVDTILQAAERLKDRPVRFEIVGGGTDLERLQKTASEKRLTNVAFLGRLPLEEMPKVFARADAMLVTLQKNAALNQTLPGKVQSYMAAGKPIIGAIDGETARIIQEARCGYCGPAEDGEALAQNIRRLMAEGNLQILGDNARAFYEANFERRVFMDRLEEELKKL